LLRAGDGARPDQDIFAAMLHEISNDCDGIGDGHGDFDDGDASLADCLDGAVSLIHGRGADDGDNTDFADPADYFVNTEFSGWH
jgi:hypothetical protein